MRFLTIFGLVSLAEMATFFWVESRIGLVWALGIAIATAIGGSILVRRAGLSVLRRIRERAAMGEVPGRELSDGAAILVSGAFLISPGFLTDLVGFALLVPAVRRLVYQRVSTRIMGRVGVYTSSTSRRPGSHVEEVFDESDIIDIDVDDLN